MTAVPADDVTKSNYLKPSMFFSISASTEHPDEAVAVLNYLINSVEAMSYINDVITPNCTPIGPPDPEGSGEVKALLQQLEEKVAYGEYTPEQAAEEYFTEENKIYQSH